MVSAFDVTDTVIAPHGSYDKSHLVGWHQQETGEVSHSWNLDTLPDFLKKPTADVDWRNIYFDVPYRTQTQVTSNARAEAIKDGKNNRILKIAFGLWIAAIPATWAIVQYLGPDWLALAVLIYSLCKAWLAWQRLMGNIKISNREEEKSEKQRKMDHYFYHCERNPDAFSRLKVENIERDIKERTIKEANELKSNE
jgi:hypothetical protein